MAGTPTSLDLLEAHQKHVSRVSARIASFNAHKTPFRIYHGSTNSTRPVIRLASTSVDISALNNVLSIDTERRIASVEPNVPMDTLVAATLPLSLVPPVIPEFPGITVGGGFAGTAGESSSFKHGFLDATAERVEVVLADGTVKDVGRGDPDEDLFFGLAGTLGTIGVLTRLDIRLVEAKPLVKLTYLPVTSFEIAMDVIKRETREAAGNDFVDGIMFAPDRGAICVGSMVAAAGKIKLTRFTRRSDPWYYLHVKKRVEAALSPTINKRAPPAICNGISGSGATNGNSVGTTLGVAQAHDHSSAQQDTNGHSKNLEKTSQQTELGCDYVPLTDYLFRYDRGGFWVGRLAFSYFRMPFLSPMRRLLDTYMHTRPMYHALHAAGMHESYIIEDLAVPFPKAREFSEWIGQDMDIWPLWLCPLKFKKMGLEINTLKNLPEDELLVNVGVWGEWPKKYESWEDANRALEKKCHDLGGVKWLYAQMFYTEDEFWNVYNRDTYTALREKYGASNLPDVYDKVSQRKEKEKQKNKRGLMSKGMLPGFYGFFKMKMGGDYILKR